MIANVLNVPTNIPHARDVVIQRMNAGVARHAIVSHASAYYAINVGAIHASAEISVATVGTMMISNILAEAEVPVEEVDPEVIPETAEEIST